MNLEKAKIEVNEIGYSILANVYSEHELNSISNCIDNVSLNSHSVQHNQDVYAIRQLLRTIPQLYPLLFNNNLLGLLNYLFDSTYFLTKAIYFDKPENSNWFVPYHQDLSISVDKKAEVENYINWTFKKEQYGVQPPTKILEDTITLRIHLDHTNAHNGALNVIPKSHLNGVIRKDSKHWHTQQPQICSVKKGGVMLMKPLILHASNKTTNKEQRRVIHLEFNHQELSKPLNWSEKLKII
ncbi:phytanoyl-CoA dioxygenase family protein [Seonamhaeicola marinus]|uniref:Phytanoyl-CoA dioxygenase family protein n=1 Tax=Seonamhaeicola marinus TaxID=1912246 RepID=A0A5D0HS37_9FLAO|nr:phytanoyl-CoA dioxygenase family protein [Seonamhaeicola marinus]TYA74173.1 phytanoyl-CoA dioxygenase family protein [Seonamhaeicola marinus]